jgi:hypothetical protein
MTTATGQLPGLQWRGQSRQNQLPFLYLLTERGKCADTVPSNQRIMMENGNFFGRSILKEPLQSVASNMNQPSFFELKFP